LPVTLHVTEHAKQTLAERAAARGMDLAAYISMLVEQTAAGEFSLEAISGDTYRRFLESGISDAELSDELEQAKHELRRERRARRAS